MDHYIADATYHRLVEAIMKLEPSPITGGPDMDKIQEALGEIGGIWPACIESSAEATAKEAA
ncbi:hypothetical protein [Mesorhizobium sp. L-8-3]|uniref:hypothetical protein n=1 Tax=Mesorhizobium sp. L-8-3 TaxID=2744522 RepID=UPI00192944BC|nr:hypothetical protein [Mesorhizobium sp. L-8-3]BCH26109.1 hypothetical protein MesoLjLb_58940 [Mesorhizobium sp. L-8-3]